MNGNRRIVWSAGGIAGLVVMFAALVVFLRRMDWPARPDQVPTELAHVLGTNTEVIAAFHQYELGGFIDHQWLWRIEAKSNCMQLLSGGLGLQQAASVPDKFWKMPPYYWPRSMPSMAEAFQSPGFQEIQEVPTEIIFSWFTTKRTIKLSYGSRAISEHQPHRGNHTDQRPVDQMIFKNGNRRYLNPKLN